MDLHEFKDSLVKIVSSRQTELHSETLPQKTSKQTNHRLRERKPAGLGVGYAFGEGGDSTPRGRTGKHGVTQKSSSEKIVKNLSPGRLFFTQVFTGASFRISSNPNVLPPTET